MDGKNGETGENGKNEGLMKDKRHGVDTHDESLRLSVHIEKDAGIYVYQLSVLEEMEGGEEGL